MRTALVLGLALLSAPARSLAEPGDTWLVATLGSHHFSDVKYNQHNYGVGFETATKLKDVSVIGGAYRNSFYATTAYAGVSWMPLAAGPARFGLSAGVGTGYGPPVIPIVFPEASIEKGKVGANIYYLPRSGGADNCAVLGFQAKFKF